MAGDDHTEETAPEDDASKETGTDDAATSPGDATGSSPGDDPGTEGADGDDENGDGGDEPKEFDVDAAGDRLKDVDSKIAEARTALDDVEEDETPSSEGPPVAEGEGAANAPPG